MAAPLKTVFVCHSSEIAGAETSLLTLLERLDLDRVDPLALLRTNGPFQDRLEDLGVPLRFAPIVVWINQRDARMWERFGVDLEGRVRSVARLLERERADLVVTNSAVALEGAVAARMVGVPHLWRVHEMLFRHDNLGPALPMEAHPAMLEALSERVAVVSRAVRDELAARGVSRRRMELVYNGLPPYPGPRRRREETIGVPEGAPVVVFVGTLSDAKGVPLLADVMKPVLARFGEARCVLVGRDVGGKVPLERRARALGVERAFLHLGFRDDPMEIVAHADALILPSKVDSLPSAVMEAMAAGVPAIATRSGGAEELIVDGETGALSDVDDAEAMADALLALFADPERRRAMGAVAQARCRAVFSADGYASAMQRLFERVAACEPPRPASGAMDRLVSLLGEAARDRHDPRAAARLVDHLGAISADPPGLILGADRGAARPAGPGP